MTKSVFCIVTRPIQAEAIARRLIADGFSNRDISVYMTGNEQDTGFAFEEFKKNIEEGQDQTSFAGALIQMGMPEYEAKRYEGKIKRGNILIAVHADDDEEILKARLLFENQQAQDIALNEEIHVPHQTK